MKYKIVVSLFSKPIDKLLPEIQSQINWSHASASQLLSYDLQGSFCNRQVLRKYTNFKSNSFYFPGLLNLDFLLFLAIRNVYFYSCPNLVEPDQQQNKTMQLWGDMFIYAGCGAGLKAYKYQKI